ncbi:MAG: LamG domain-containing protein [Cyanobacteria bacterium P01_A01_bin.17]
MGLVNNVFDLGSDSNQQHNSKTPDLETFDRLDDIVTTVHRGGGRVHFWLWGDRQRGTTPEDAPGSEADKRIQSYIAARLGPLPGWSMGYSFDAQEWTNPSQINQWASRINDQSGWDHLLFARGYRNSSGPNPNGDDSRWTASELSGHSYSSKGSAQQGLQTSPVGPNSIEEVIADINRDRGDPHFYEERFTRNRNRVGSTQGQRMTDEKTADVAWWTAMAGGVGNWYGYFNKGGSEGPSYSNREDLRTHYTFWHEKGRFTLDLEQANNRADSPDTHILKRSNNSRYIVYAEDRDSVQLDLDVTGSGARAIAVDTEQGYQERDLGFVGEGNNRRINLPYRSDWAIVLEGGQSGGGRPPVTPDPPFNPPGNPAPNGDVLLHWKLDDGNGSRANDSSPFNRDGSLQNGVGWTGGRRGGGAGLDGSNDHIARNGDFLTGLDKFTIALWFKADQVGSDRGIVTADANVGNDKPLGIRFDSRGASGGGRNLFKVGLTTTAGSTEYESASNVQSTGWTHIAMTWESGEEIEFFINGEKDRPTDGGRRLGGTLTGIEEFVVGLGSKDDAHWDGAIDDVLILDRELKNAEVAQLYSGNYSGIV